MSKKQKTFSIISAIIILSLIILTLSSTKFRGFLGLSAAVGNQNASGELVPFNAEGAERDLVDTTGAVFGKTKVAREKITVTGDSLYVDDLRRSSADADGVLLIIDNNPVLEVRGKAVKAGKSNVEANTVAATRRAEIKKAHADIKTKAEQALKSTLVFSGPLHGQAKGKIRAIEYTEAMNGYALFDVPVQDTIKKLSQIKGVTVVPNTSVHMTLIDSVPQTKANQVWQYTDKNGLVLDGKGMRIGVIDTGVDYTHPSLGKCFGSGCKVADGYDFVNNDKDPMDDMGHGTHVAGTVAGYDTFIPSGQTTPVTIRGTAPGATIYAYKVLDAGGSGWTSAIISAIQRCADPNQDGIVTDRLDVCTLSLGGPGNPDDTTSLAVDAASANGVTFTIAGGNSGPSAQTIGSPGTARTAITVAAACKTGYTGNYCTSSPIATFSSRGPVIWNNVDLKKPDIAAPGVRICSAFTPTAADAGWSICGTSTNGTSKYASIDGTSMATPHMAGIVALLRQAHPELTPADVKDLLKKTSTAYSGISADVQGAGFVDALGALKLSGIPQSLVEVSGDVPLVVSDTVTTLSQSFVKNISIKNVSTTSITFTPSTSILDPGIKVTFSPSSLTIPVGGTANLVITTTINHSVVSSPQSVNGVVTLSSSSGNIVFGMRINIQNRLISDVASVELPGDNKDLPTWSTQKIINFRNTLTDTATSYVVSSTSIPGVTITPSVATLVLPKGATLPITFSITADNSIVPDGWYTGSFTLASPLETVVIPFSFFKGYVVTMTYGDLAGGCMNIYTKNEALLQYYCPTSNTTQKMYTTIPGPYNFLVFPSWPGFTNAKFIIQRGVTSSVNLTYTDAIYKVRMNPTNPDGTIGVGGYLLTLADISAVVPNTSYVTIGGAVNGAEIINPTFWINAFDSNVKMQITGTSGNPTGRWLSTFMYQIEDGLSHDYIFGNTITDFGVRNLYTTTNKNYGKTVYLYPAICPTADGRVAACSVPAPHKDLFIPVTMTSAPIAVYSYANTQVTPPTSTHDIYPSVYFGLGTDPGGGWDYINPIYQTVDLYLGKTVAYAWKQGNVYRNIDGLFANKYANWKLDLPPNNTLYVGEGPIVDSGKFVNYADNRDWINSCYIGKARGAGGYYSSYGSSSPFHSFGGLSYEWLYNGNSGSAINLAELPVSYSLKLNGQVVDQGKINETTDWTSNYMNYRFPTDPITPGTYEFTAIKTTTINSIPTESKTTVTFPIVSKASYQTNPVDENPPYIAKLNLISGGLWQSVIDPTTTNLISFEINPNPKITGTTAEGCYTDFIYGTDSVVSVKASQSIDGGVTWIPLSINTASGISTTTVVTNTTTSLYGFKIEAIDGAGNTLSYQFQVPKGTVITGGTPPDTIPPTVSLTAPTNGATVSGAAVTVTANAIDNVGGSGITTVEFYAGAKLLGTDTTAPYSIVWDTKNGSFPNGTYSLTVKAFDVAGNSSTSSVVSVAVANTTQAYPTTNITSPTSTALPKGGSVKFTATASDSSSIISITLSIDNALKQTCSNVTTCSYTWSMKGVSAGSHTLSVTATNKSGLQTIVSKIVTK